MDFDIFIKKLKTSNPNYIGDEAIAVFADAVTAVQSQPCLSMQSFDYGLDAVAVIADNCMKSIAKIEKDDSTFIESFSPFAIVYSETTPFNEGKFWGMIYSNLIIGYMESAQEGLDKLFWLVVRKEDFDKIADYEVVNGT